MTSVVSKLFASSAHARARRNTVIAYSLCPVFLAISCYGFWQCFNLLLHVHSMERDELYTLISLTVLPLLLFVYLSMTAAQGMERFRVSASYQSRFNQLQKRVHYQEDLLQLVINCRPEAVTIYDRDRRYWFMNDIGAQKHGQEARDIIGKSISELLNHEQTRQLETRLIEVQNANQPIETVEQMTDETGDIRFMQMHFTPVSPFNEFSGGVMVREEDITNLVIERERRENMLRQVISTLLAVIDRRDPYAAGHSARVGQLARGVAGEMRLNEKLIETSEIAGSLMNFGKVLVPREILTKTTTLEPEELQRVRDSILTSADILSIIDFVGPVVPTLRQVLEKFDGSGSPQGLKGNDILLTARIVTVANAYVALVSPRAHRPSMDPSKAITIMMQEADKSYDKNVLVALDRYLKNSSTTLDWLMRTKPS